MELNSYFVNLGFFKSFIVTGVESYFAFRSNRFPNSLLLKYYYPNSKGVKELYVEFKDKSVLIENIDDFHKFVTDNNIESHYMDYNDINDKISKSEALTNEELLFYIDFFLYENDTLPKNLSSYKTQIASLLKA